MANEEQSKQKTKRTSAKKREIQDARKRLANRAFRSEVRSMIRKFREAVAAGNKAALKTLMSEVYSLVDKGAKKSIFKRNKASRIKARVTAAFHKIA